MGPVKTAAGKKWKTEAGKKVTSTDRAAPEATMDGNGQKEYITLPWRMRRENSPGRMSMIPHTRRQELMLARQKGRYLKKQYHDMRQPRLMVQFAKSGNVKMPPMGGMDSIARKVARQAQQKILIGMLIGLRQLEQVLAEERLQAPTKRLHLRPRWTTQVTHQMVLMR